MTKEADENLSQMEVIGRFKTPDGEDAEVVKLTEDAEAISDAEIRPFAEALTETDLKDSVFTHDEDPEKLREWVVNKKIKQIKEIISRGEALLIRIGDKFVAIQGLVEKAKMPDGRPLLEFTKGATIGEYEGKGLAKTLIAYNIQYALDSRQDAILIGYSRNQNVLDAFKKYGWHIVDTDSPHPIARVYNKDTDGDTLKKLTKDGYKVIYFDPKNEIHPNDKMEVENTSKGAKSRIRELFSWK